MADISIFIPVFKESEQLPSMLEKLEKQDLDKEIIVPVDEPTERFMEETKRFHTVKFLINNQRIGKANALNLAVKQSTGKVLLFLDSDVELTNDSYFLKKIVMEMQRVDMLDIKKKVKRDSFLSKMAYYEYLTFNMSAWIATKFMHKCPAVNGAAFAIRREKFEAVGGFRPVVAEDIDIATRAFLKNSSFAYTKDVEVENIVYSNWRKWFSQRKRWATGQALWLKDWYRILGKKFLLKPQILLPGLFFLYPSVIIFFLNFVVPSTWMYQSLLVFSFVLSMKFNIGLPVFLVSLATADIVKAVIISLASFGFTAAVFFGFSRKLGFNVKLHELFVYYFFYSLLWFGIIVVGFIQAVFLKRRPIPDWKV